MEPVQNIYLTPSDAEGLIDTMVNLGSELVQLGVLTQRGTGIQVTTCVI